MNIWVLFGGGAVVSVPDRGNSGYQACEAGASLLLNGAAIGQVLLSSANFY